MFSNTPHKLMKNIEEIVHTLRLIMLSSTQRIHLSLRSRLPTAARAERLLKAGFSLADLAEDSLVATVEAERFSVGSFLFPGPSTAPLARTRFCGEEEEEGEETGARESGGFRWETELKDMVAELGLIPGLETVPIMVLKSSASPPGSDSGVFLLQSLCFS